MRQETRYLRAAVMERIPILKMGQFLLVTIQVDMHDRLALALQDDLTARIVAEQANGVLIDISSLEMVDSFIGRMISRHRRDGARARRGTVWSACAGGGDHPGRAGLSLEGVRTALDVERGMDLLRTHLAVR